MNEAPDSVNVESVVTADDLLRKALIAARTEAEEHLGELVSSYRDDTLELTQMELVSWLQERGRQVSAAAQ